MAAESQATLSVEKLVAQGWKPTPFRQFLLKIHSRCNLACDYCYVYTLADQSWRNQPRVMTPTLTSIVADRIAEHVSLHGLDTIRLIFHGGEPLLAGADPLVNALRMVRAAVGANVRIDSVVQTNGTLLNQRILHTLNSFNIRVGVSVDGDEAAHNRSRKYANGRGSYTEIAGALRLLMRHPSIYSGLLCVVDPTTDPVATYEKLIEFTPPTIDFLLPHGNWSSPPRGLSKPPFVPYAKWLIAVFDRWYSAPSRETHIRMFEEIIHLLLGGKSATEAVGLTPTSLVVIETDGRIEQSDALKSVYNGAASTGLHVTCDSFDDALRRPEFAARQIGIDALGDECSACSVRRICGAGLYPHRYRRGSGFRNPSVYCMNLYSLINHIRERVIDDLSKSQRS